MLHTQVTYHKGNVRTDLLEQGLRILSEEGLGAVSLRRLAREVGIVPSAVYNHFKNRDEMMAALAATGYDRLLEREQTAFRCEAEFKPAMLAVARAYFLFATANPDLYRLMFSWELSDAKKYPELARSGYSFFGESVRWWYGVEYDASRPASEYPAPLLAWASIHGLAMIVIQNSITLKNADETALTELIVSFEELLFSGLDSLTPALKLTD